MPTDERLILVIQHQNKMRPRPLQSSEAPKSVSVNPLQGNHQPARYSNAYRWQMPQPASPATVVSPPNTQYIDGSMYINSIEGNNPISFQSLEGAIYNDSDAQQPQPIQHVGAFRSMIAPANYSQSSSTSEPFYNQRPQLIQGAYNIQSTYVNPAAPPTPHVIPVSNGKNKSYFQKRMSMPVFSAPSSSGSDPPTLRYDPPLPPNADNPRQRITSEASSVKSPEFSNEPSVSPRDSAFVFRRMSSSQPQNHRRASNVSLNMLLGRTSKPSSKMYLA